LHMNGQDSLVQPLLTDFYQITMCYGYWLAGIHDEPAVFDLFFRKNPFHGEFTIFAGLEDCLRFVESFRFSKSDIDFIRKLLPEDCNPDFFKYLNDLDCGGLVIKAIPEGSAVFPKTPLITVEGPLAVCQLLETTFLNLVNYASLMATNASRFRQAAGNKVQMLEFGLRRAQGPNGGLTASKYSYIGGFDGTSNVLAGKLFGIPVKGTQAHSFVCSFSSDKDLKVRTLRDKHGSEERDLYELSLSKRHFIMQKVEWGVSESEVSNGELAAFVAYAVAFPSANMSLIDTYDVLRSGVINFVAVTLALFELGYKSIGCRIDSGDLSYLSKEVRSRLRKVAVLDPALVWLEKMVIVASNDINEETIMSLNEQSHEINAFGVGTHLVTCQKQPALGCVYKLVTLSGQPKIKLSQEVSKITIPGRKKCYRLFGKSGYAILDLLILEDEPEPKANQQILCLCIQESKRALVVASRVEPLHEVFWSDGRIVKDLPDLKAIKAGLCCFTRFGFSPCFLWLPFQYQLQNHVNNSLNTLRKDHRRYLNPTPYKVSVSEKLYDFLHSLWLQNAPIGQLE
uniref:Nicotinate phosphoribosyltransferase n=1 Tax=Haemonchus placei TaxID=6290 RepID=A0A0N4W7D2_HAEPC